MRSHEDKTYKALRSLIHNSVHLPRFRKDGLPGFERNVFISGAERSLAFEHNHHFVFADVSVGSLRLSWFQAIDVAEEARSFEEVVLAHSYGIEFAKVFELDDLHGAKSNGYTGNLSLAGGESYIGSARLHPSWEKTLRIFLHARAAELTGKTEIDIRASAGATVAEVKRALASQVPALAPLVSSSALATDREYLGDSALVGDEKSLHLIPPVSGG